MKKVHAVKKMIIEARKQAGLTQRAMAERLGMSQPAYAYYETGTRSVGEEKLRQISRQLELPLEPFLEAAAQEAPVKLTLSRQGRRPARARVAAEKKEKPAKARRAGKAETMPVGLKPLLMALNEKIERIALALEKKD